MLLKRLRENQWISQEHVASRSPSKGLSSRGQPNSRWATTGVGQPREAWGPGRDQLRIRSYLVTKRNVLLLQHHSITNQVTFPETRFSHQILKTKNCLRFCVHRTAVPWGTAPARSHPGELIKAPPASGTGSSAVQGSFCWVWCLWL